MSSSSSGEEGMGSGWTLVIFGLDVAHRVVLAPKDKQACMAAVVHFEILPFRLFNC